VKRISASTSAMVTLSPAISRKYSARRMAPARSRSFAFDGQQIAAHVDTDIQLLFNTGQMLGVRTTERRNNLLSENSRW